MTDTLLSDTLSPDTLPSVLQRLYNTLNGSQWHHRTLWNKSSFSLDQWWGMSPTSVQRSWRHIMDLYQPSLPPHHHPNVLNLVDNNLKGTMESDLWEDLHRAWPELIAISLANNTITGSLPWNMDTLFSELQEIHLWSNQFSGCIPPSLGSLSKLERLNLSHNRFTGSIPASIGNLTNLQSLSFEFNVLTGSLPSEIGYMSRLEVLTLSGNKLSGPIPDSIGHLFHLTLLDLSANEFSGTIPDTIGNLQQLQQFNVSLNVLEGSLPTSLWTVSTLTHLQGWANRLSGMLPDSMGALVPNLEVLQLSCNAFSGTLPTSLGNCSQLRELYLNHNEFTGLIPEAWGSISTMTECVLSNNHLTGSIPTTLSSWMSLQQLDLSNNGFQGGLPMFVCTLTNLTNLSLAYNTLQGEIPIQLTKLAKLKELRLNNNSFSGHFPPYEEASFTIASEYDMDDHVYTNHHPVIHYHKEYQFPVMKYFDISNNVELYYNPSTMRFHKNYGYHEVHHGTKSPLRHESWLNWCKTNPDWGGTSNFLDNVKYAVPSLEQQEILTDQRYTQESHQAFHSVCHLLLTWYAQQNVGRQEEHEEEEEDWETRNRLWTHHRGWRWNTRKPFLPSHLDGICLDSIYKDIYMGDIHSFYTTYCILNLVPNCLHVWDNNIKGPLPSSFPTSWPSLQFLTLGRNPDLSLTFSDHIIPLIHLVVLNLSRTHVTGPIPPEIGRLQQLAILQCQHTPLSGSIPSEIGSLVNLQHLLLGENKLVGEIPSSIGNLTNLTALYIYNNKGITGLVPTSLQNLIHLECFMLQGNDPSCQVPFPIARRTPFTKLTDGKFVDLKGGLVWL